MLHLGGPKRKKSGEHDNGLHIVAGGKSKRESNEIALTSGSQRRRKKVPGKNSRYYMNFFVFARRNGAKITFGEGSRQRRNKLGKDKRRRCTRG